MGRLARIMCDVALAVLATLSAIFLRADLVVEWPNLAASLPYLSVTAGIAALAVGASGLDLGFWRFASLVDIAKVVAVAAVTTLGTVAVVFAYNRLEGVARAIPVMQGVLIVVFLLAPRLVARARFAMRPRNPAPVAAPAPAATVETVLIVGQNSLTEVFLRALREAGDARVRVAGIVCTRRRHVGRFLRQYPVLGTVEEIGPVIADLRVHGVEVARVILAVPLGSLPLRVRENLRQLETARGIRLDPLIQRLSGIGPERGAAGPAPAPRALAAATPVFALTALRPADLERMAQSPYWRWKRRVDVLASLVAALLLMPIGAAVALLAVVDLGWPPIFWQNRLGLGGESFRLYKFRTMAPGHDAQGTPIPDADRLSAIGALLRRTRLDELPQLWNVLVGDMSLTGPRPLLPVDQPREGLDRLAVRPGVTGWAQVQGGRTVTAAEKAALDLWWMTHASFSLDLSILSGTVRMVLTGERVNDGAIAQARAILERAILERAIPERAGAEARPPRTPPRILNGS